MNKHSKASCSTAKKTRFSKLSNATKALVERMEPRFYFSAAVHDQAQSSANLLFDGPVKHGNNVDLFATPATQIGNVVQRVYTSTSSYSGSSVATSTVAVGHVGPNSPVGSASVRLSDGTLSQNISDLTSNGFGTPWGVTRSWTNNPGYPDSGLIGNGWMLSQEPQLYLSTMSLGGPAIVVTSGSSAQWFLSNGDTSSPTFSSEFWSQNTLKYANNSFVLTDGQGNQTTFFGASGVPTAQQGAFESYQPVGGQEIHAAYNTQGILTNESRSENYDGQLVTETFAYSYYQSGPSNGNIQNIAFEQQVGTSAPVVIKQAFYDYYDGSFNSSSGQAFGNANDLRSVTIKDGQGLILSTDYYRYYVPNDSDNHGYTGGLKYEISGTDFSNFAASLSSTTTPYTASDDLLRPCSTRSIYDLPETQ